MKLRPMRALVHPLFLSSTLLLLLNDRVFKGSGLLPGVLTGKLSDVAGMFVAPLVLAALARVETRRGLLAAHVIVGIGFTAFELSDAVTSIGRALYASVGLHWHATRDLTDLATLACLVPSYLLFARISERAAGRRAVAPERGACAAALLICAGSSETSDPPVWTPTSDNDFDGYEIDEDCNDFDAAVNPGAGNCPGDTEHCNNGVDDNADGLTDCDDADCVFACEATQQACATTEDVALGAMLTSSTAFDPTWALEGSCGGADSPEQIFTFTTTETVTLTVYPPPGHVVYVREACDEPLLELGCAANPEDAEDVEPLVVTLNTPSNYALVVDAIDGGMAGPFQIELQLSNPDCGDGEPTPGEACDDGNTANWDGCNEACEIEGLGCSLAVSLPGTSATFTFGENASVDLRSSCGDALDAELDLDPERTFWFIAPQNGTLELTTSSSTANLWLSTRIEDDPTDDTCPAAELSCDAQAILGEPIVRAIELSAGQKVFVIVETSHLLVNEATVFDLGATFTPAL